MSYASARPGNSNKARREEMKRTLEEEWAKFTSRYSSDEICIEEICQMLDIDVFRCANCQSVNVERRAKARAIKCSKCKQTVWLTAGSLFHGIRLATVWFGALYLMTNGVQFNANQFHEVAGIAYSTAWTIVKKLTFVIKDQFPQEISVPSADFAAVICKRSKETPAKKHPGSEEAGQSRTSADTAVQDEEELLQALGPQAKEVYDALLSEPLSFDSLCNCTGMAAPELSAMLTLLELSGLVIALAGGRYCRSSSNQRPKALATESGSEMTKRAIDFIRETFQGISRKYLQLHLAAHWCWIDRARWSPQSLLKECLEIGRVSSAEILAYVSPCMVKTAPSTHVLSKKMRHPALGLG